MARVTNTPARLRRKRRLLKAAKGYWGATESLHKVLKENLHRAWAYSYKGRSLKKRDFRSLWITRLSPPRAPAASATAADPGPHEGRRHAQPQDALRARHPRPEGLRRGLRDREARSDGVSRGTGTLARSGPRGRLRPAEGAGARRSRSVLERIRDGTKSPRPATSRPSKSCRRRWLGKQRPPPGTPPRHRRAPRGRSAAPSARPPTSSRRRSRPSCSASSRPCATAQEGAIGDAEWVDATLPGERRGRGHVHPVAQMRRELEDMCLSMGFEVLDGPWVEDELPQLRGAEHPDRPPRARHAGHLLVSPDGNAAAHAHVARCRSARWRRSKPPIRVVAIGRVFRNEATRREPREHVPPDRGPRCRPGRDRGHLVHTLDAALRGVFGGRRGAPAPVVLPVHRARPSRSTCAASSARAPAAPSASRAAGSRSSAAAWSTRASSRRRHRPRRSARGFAFGLGLDRVLMMRYGIEDIRRLMAATSGSCGSSRGSRADEALLELARRDTSTGDGSTADEAARRLTLAHRRGRAASSARRRADKLRRREGLVRSSAAPGRGPARLCTVDVGGASSATVVCGAPNVAAGQIVCCRARRHDAARTAPRPRSQDPRRRAARG